MRTLRIAGCTAQHRGDRPEQQDRVAILASRLAPRCALGVLADGHGGRRGGAIAAENALLTCRSRFDNFSPDDQAVGDFFRSLVDEAHAVLKLTALASDLEPHTTLATVLVQPGRVDWCHVGDSRVYHLRAGRVAHRTVDHTAAHRRHADATSAPPAGSRALASAAERLVHSLGAHERPPSTVGGIDDPQPGDVFLACSDGFWQHVDEHDIGRIATENPVRDAAEKLVALARENARGRGDNCSLVLLRLEG
jgi:serine/threonine protein phosphatase PrpC